MFLTMFLKIFNVFDGVSMFLKIFKNTAMFLIYPQCFCKNMSECTALGCLYPLYHLLPLALATLAALTFLPSVPSPSPTHSIPT
jgi:hypothetical protein